MKLKNLFQIFVVALITFTLPVSQVYAVFPDIHPPISDVMEQFGGEFDILASGIGQDMPVFNISTSQLVKSTAIRPAQIVEDEAPALEAVELKEVPEMEFVPIQVEDRPFWSKRKIVVGTAIILTATALLAGLLFLLGGSGSGSDSGSGAGGGGGFGGDPNNPGNPGDPNNPGNPGDPNNPGNPGDPNNPFVPPVGPVGGDPENPFIPGGPVIPGGVPHNPEPSTFLLMGLGLIVPLLRKRWS